MDWQIPLFRIYWDKADIAAVEKAISRGMNWAVGPEVTEFEEKLSEYLNVKYCLTFNSGTSALHAVLLAYGLGPGDEVIVPSFTFIATANAALFVGARPVFADIEEQTCGLDAADVERKISPKTKAIIPIHYAGCPCQIEALRDVARRHNLILIEDAAEALGAKINRKRAGSFGDSAILSFCQNKTITTGEGGAVATNSGEIHDKLKLLRSHGRLEDGNYFSSIKYMDYVALGYNFRMSNITAALGLAQLKKLDKIVEMRRRHAQVLSQKLSRSAGIILPDPPEDYYHVYQMYSIRVPGNIRDGLVQHLADGGILSKVFFYPVHKTHFYKNRLKYNAALPMTEMISTQVLSLPIYPRMNQKEINQITSNVNAYLSKIK
jgi:perosamine synthetase